MSSLTLGTLQYALFPALLLLILCVRIAKARVPRAVFMFALGGCLMSAAAAFAWWPSSNWAVAAAVLQNDEFEVETFKLRERINSFLRHQGGARAVRFHREFSNAKEASDYLAENTTQRALLWGNRGWINISLPETEPLLLGGTRLGAQYEMLKSVKLVSSVPGVGLSIAPRNESAQFVAAIVLALSEGGASLGMPSERSPETVLRDAGNLFAPWSASAHRALPWWLLGNRLTLDFLNQSHYERATLLCAREAFLRALSFVRAKDAVSADLYAAAKNNLAVLALVESVVEGSTHPIHDARPLFREALVVRSSPNVYGLELRPVKVALDNLEYFKKILHKHRHSKKS